MSRTVADATRFTATSPHAYSNSTIAPSIFSTANKSSSSPAGTSSSKRPPPPPSAYSPPPPPPPPPETPAQKVARIRAQRAAEKLNQLTLWDKTVLRGRVWATRAHRVTTYSLIGLTVAAAAITSFSLFDMILYNRHQRRLFYATQQSLYDDTLRLAIENIKSGQPLTEDQTGVINREQMILKAEYDREQRKKNWYGLKDLVFGGMTMGDEDDDEGKGQLVKGMEDLIGGKATEGWPGAGEKVMGMGEAVGQEKVMRAFEEETEGSRGVGENNSIAIGGLSDQTAIGGPLDRMAENAAEAGKKEVQKAKGGWSTWFGLS